MTRSLKVSIITVVFNNKSKIQEAINSVLNQTYPNIEYIVIDGGSTDGTVALVNSFGNRFSKFISETDNGLYDAMNKGVKLATGDIVGILNSDDVFYNDNVIQNIVNFHLINEIDASIGNIVQHKNGKPIRLYNSSNWKPEKLKVGFMPPHPSIFFKRELFEKLGYYRLDFISAADYELVTRFFLKNNLSYKYSGITTTSMAMGGISSSGLKSYFLISQEICRLLKMNEVAYSSLKIYFRFVWKIKGLFN